MEHLLKLASITSENMYNLVIKDIFLYMLRPVV